jgi:hypothetical protein
VIVLAVLLLLSGLTIMVLTYLLGFRVGGNSWLSETQRVKAEAAAAERQLHELTRSAFVAMAEEAERRRRNG